MEVKWLDQLEMAFESKALRDHDVPAGVLMVKIAERRATLLGLNPSPGYAVAVIQHEPPAAKTSTEEIAELIVSIRGRDKPQLDSKDPG